MPSVQDSLVGQTLGHYRIAEKIGTGGMGEVYRARDEHLARDVAIKVLPPGTLTDESARKHFHKEALILSQLNHPNVATIYDFDTQQGLDFLVMEYIPGITLNEKVAARPLPEKEVLRLGVQLAEGLAAAHDHKVVHRDLKPGNLRVTSDGRLKILDFGLAKLRLPVAVSTATESLSETETLAGTLPYMAPEQLLGEQIDARTDIHAAGSVLYEMATGRRPFADVENSQLIGAILRRPPRPPTTLNSRLSPELERIIGKCLEKEPENRYQSAKELAVDLRQLGVHSLPVTLAPTVSRTRWKRTGILAGVVFAALVLILGSNLDKWQEWLPGHGVTPIRSLAVLPLANLSGDPQQEYFADGMTEELITNLSKISALKVISRTSVMRYKRSNKPLPEIARELNVDGIIEGSVLSIGNQVRVTAQLIRARTDQHIWADSYQRDVRDVLALQAELARDIARRVRAALTLEQEARLGRTYTVDPEALHSYLKGRYHWNNRTEAELRQAIEFFREAIEKDPGYAPAYAGLADSYNLLPQYGDLPVAEVIPMAKRAATKSLELDSGLAEAHTALAFANQEVRDWATAEKEYKRALELDPSYATTHHWYAVFLSETGRLEEAVAQIKQAQELDPLSAIIHTGAAFPVYFQLRQWDLSIEQCRKAIDLNPNFAVAHNRLGFAYEYKGSFEQAIAEHKAAVRLSDGAAYAFAGLAHAHALAGHQAEARRILRELQGRSKRGFVNPYHIATIQVALGENNEALASLEKAFREDYYDNQLFRSPLFASVASDPRFQDLLRRMNFPQ
jgi:serine/threonine-protein kinase